MTHVLIGAFGRHVLPDEKKATSKPMPVAKTADEAAPSGGESNLRGPDAPIPAHFSDREWEAAFPGQAVVNGCPNQMRMAMIVARALVRAVDRDDMVLAERYMRANHRFVATAQREREAQRKSGRA